MIINFNTLSRADEKVGEESSVSYGTVRKVETLLKFSNEDQLVKLGAGKVSISHVFTNYKRSRYHEETPKLPKGEFDVILCDPHPRYEMNLRDWAEQHYQTMDYKEIEEMKIPSADNCVLFLWTTQSLIKESLFIMENWDFKYKSGAVWVKDKIGTGYYFMFRHELLLIGVKGTMPIPEERNRGDSVIEAPRRKHSEKPYKVYEMIETMYPNRKYLELFARSKYNEKWSVWGLEAPLIK